MIDEFVAHKVIDGAAVAEEYKKIHPGGAFINLDRGKWGVAMTKNFVEMQIKHGVIQ